MPDSLLMLPGDPGFAHILATNPPPDLVGTDETARSVVIGVDGMPRSVQNLAELEDYLYGGEWDEVVADYDDPFFEELEL
jgi:hypothetical protein